MSQPEKDNDLPDEHAHGASGEAKCDSDEDGEDDKGKSLLGAVRELVNPAVVAVVVANLEMVVSWEFGAVREGRHSRGRRHVRELGHGGRSRVSVMLEGLEVL